MSTTHNAVRLCLVKLHPNLKDKDCSSSHVYAVFFSFYSSNMHPFIYAANNPSRYSMIHIALVQARIHPSIHMSSCLSISPSINLVSKACNKPASLRQSCNQALITLSIAITHAFDIQLFVSLAIYCDQICNIPIRILIIRTEKSRWRQCCSGKVLLPSNFVLLLTSGDRLTAKS